MERGQGESSSSRLDRWERKRPVLGCFLNLERFRQTSPRHDDKVTPRHRFIGSTPKGAHLKNGKWGALDESLAFLGEPVNILASFNSALLCKASNTEGEDLHYVVCNPVTREFRHVPLPPQYEKYAVYAFMCKGDNGNSSAQAFDFEIVRASVLPLRELKELHLDTFSSSTGEWETSCIQCRFSSTLQVREPGVLLKGVVYWKSSGGLTAYDRANVSAKLVKFPAGAGRQNPEHRRVHSYCLSACSRKLYYVCCSGHHLEVWMMQNYVNRKAKWKLMHTTSFSTIFEQNRHINRRIAVPLCHSVCGMHPYLSRFVLVSIRGCLCWYDMQTGKVIVISKKVSALFYDIFLYDWSNTTF